MPVNSTKLQLLSNDLEIGKEVTFKAISEGGKEVCYEFYIMINGEWVLAQGYSRKNYYTFIPFKSGKYRVLVLDKSFHKDILYASGGKYIFQLHNFKFNCIIIFIRNIFMKAFI